MMNKKSMDNIVIGRHLANERRSKEASERTVLLAKHILRIAGSELPPGQLQALKVRIAFPHATISKLATMSDLTKDQYWGRLRRALDHPIQY
ncbi:helix-turn-helix DNA binding domain protein [Gordonia phage Sixama]|uniref:Helix-turn-helix DNA binding domain protein n=1 Tax=Gordonia phage Sixama TaxID=2653271 RepID=A0A5Q2F0Q3_9CAUD|nr:helix-turn-helix DNA binding domain protein [Gordonia phage Sixama]QGF20340.1 helix-turn-helix DNA binding domain protein [Gordonia phage Sixama]